MKKFFTLIFTFILLTSCGGKTEKLENAANSDYVTDSFEVSYPKNWTTQEGSIDNATVYSFDSIKLITFSRAGAGLGDNPFSFEEINAKFKAAFEKVGISNIVEPDNGLSVKIITYNGAVDGFIYQPSSQVGTVAIWDNGKTTYALLDQNDMHQKDGHFQEMYQSFKFKN